MDTSILDDAFAFICPLFLHIGPENGLLLFCVPDGPRLSPPELFICFLA
jgi:hypothetical protein